MGDSGNYRRVRECREKSTLISCQGVSGGEGNVCSVGEYSSASGSVRECTESACEGVLVTESACDGE